MSAETMHTEVVESSNLDNELNTAIKKSKEDLSSLQFSIEKIDDDKKRLKKGEELEKKAIALEKILGPVRSYRLSEVKNNYIEARGKYLQDPKNENYKKLQESIVLNGNKIGTDGVAICGLVANGSISEKSVAISYKTPDGKYSLLDLATGRNIVKGINEPILERNGEDGIGWIEGGCNGFASDEKQYIGNDNFIVIDGEKYELDHSKNEILIEAEPLFLKKGDKKYYISKRHERNSVLHEYE